MENLVVIFLSNLGYAVLFMMGGWIASVVYKNVTLVDSMWGLGFPLIAWTTFFMSDGYIGRKLLIAILVTLWGLRLSIYLSWRNWGEGEDPRYRKMRQRAGKNFWIVSLYKVFLLQAALMWIISLALQFGQTVKTPAEMTVWDYSGLILWCVGFFFQAVGDGQLAKFKADPENKGKVMDKGLWAYTRHPNYFGESLMWWGIFIIAFAVPLGWWTVISPLTITYLLLKVSGIAMTEPVIKKSRPGYDAYVKTTNAFLPGFPKKRI